MCISASYTKFSLSSIDCILEVMDILPTQSRLTHQLEVMLTSLHYWPTSSLQHPDTIEYPEFTCVLVANNPLMAIYISPQLIPNSVWPLPTQVSLIAFSRFSMWHQFYTMQSPQMLEHSCIIALSVKSYAGTHIFILALSAPFGLHWQLVNDIGLLLVHLRQVCMIVFYARRL